MTRDTLIDFFDDLARARGEFLVHDDGFRTRRYTYDKVGRASRGFAARLAGTGLVKGDKVVFWSENRPEWIVAFWGCLLQGIIVVPVDYRASPEFLARVTRIVSSRLVLVGQDVPAPAVDPGTAIWKLHELDLFESALPARPTLAPDGSRQRGLAERSAKADAKISRDDIAEIIFTSGATAEPRASSSPTATSWRTRPPSSARCSSTASGAGRSSRCAS